MVKRWQRKAGEPNLPALPVALRTLALTWQSWLPKVALISGLTWWIYWPALRGDWMLDDDAYFTHNALLNGWSGLYQFWFRPGSWIEYYPVEETAIWMEWQVFGNHTLGYHLINVSLHIVGALLVWRLFSKFNLRLAWLGGLIFAIHPIQVESVANLSELKNTLSLPPFLLAMCAWIEFEEHGRKKDYEWALFFFLAAMLCKISMAAFPVIILIYAWWRRGRVQRSDLAASAPFFVVSLVLGVVTIWSGTQFAGVHQGHSNVIELGGFFDRLAGSGLNLSFYFSQCFLPVILTPFHPKWTVDPHQLVQLLPWPIVGAVLCYFWTRRKTWGKHALLGTAFFGLNLVPFLGFNRVSYMSVMWVFDHMLYLPVIGLIGLVVAALQDVETKLPEWARPNLRGLVFALCLVMVWKGHSYARVFSSQEILWTDTLQRDPANWLAQHNFGCYLMGEGRFPEAMTHLTEAIRLNPNLDQAHLNLGLLFEKMGRIPEAEDQYRQALKLNPQSAKACLSLSALLKAQGNRAEAEALLRQGLKLAPDNTLLATDLAEMLLQSGRVPEAIDLYRHIVELDPDFAGAQYDLGTSLLHTGNPAEAADHLEAAVSLNPDLVAARENLGVALAQLGRLPEAAGQFEAVIQADPQSAAARDNLARALAQTGQISAAIEQFTKELEIHPEDANARDSLAKLRHYQMQQNSPGSH